MNSNSSDEPASSPESPLTIQSSRIYHTDPVTLYSYFNDPDKLATWWGPKGFTNTFVEFDLRPGGLWRFTMQGADGAIYECHHQFLEVLAAQKIIFRHNSSMHDFTMTIRFDSVGSDTRLSWLMEFDHQEGDPNFKTFILNANEENFDRLEDLLNAH